MGARATSYYGWLLSAESRLFSKLLPARQWSFCIQVEDLNVNENIVHEILHEVFSSLEVLETQNTAILQLLKDKGLASGQELASQLEQAGNASNVRWRAAQVRIEHLITSALATAEREAKPEAPKPEKESKEFPSEAGAGTSQDEKDLLNAKENASPKKSEGRGADAGAETNEGQPAKSETRDSGREDAA